MNPENQTGNMQTQPFPGPTDPYAVPQAPVQPMPTTEAPVPPPPTPVKSKPNFLVIFISVVILFVLGVFGYWYQNFYYPVAVATESPAATSTPTVTPDVTAGWSTYENKGEGFSFKYPTNITLKIGQRDLTYKDASGNFQTIFSWNFLPIKGTLQDELTSRDSCPSDVTSGLMPGPIPNSLRCDFLNSHYTSVDIWIKNGIKMYKADISAFNPNVPIPQDQIDLLNQILGTLSFSTSTPSAAPTIRPTSSPTPGSNINY